MLWIIIDVEMISTIYFLQLHHLYLLSVFWLLTKQAIYWTSRNHCLDEMLLFWHATNLHQRRGVSTPWRHMAGDAPMMWYGKIFKWFAREILRQSSELAGDGSRVPMATLQKSEFGRWVRESSWCFILVLM